MLFRTGILWLAAATVATGASTSDPTAAWQGLLTVGVRAAAAKNYSSAEEQLQKALQLAMQFPNGDPRVGTTLNVLGVVYREEKKYAEAEKAFQKALPIFESAYGTDSLDSGNVNFNIASALMGEGHYQDAEPFITRSHTTYVRLLGAQSLKAAATLCMTGEVYRYQKKFQAAEAPLKECADVREAAEGIESTDFGDALYSLGIVYAEEGRYAIADSTLKLAEKIREIKLGITSPELADVLEARGRLLRSMKRDTDATNEEEMAAAIRRLVQKSK